MAETAAVRYNNPGAQWDGPIAKKWGSKQHVVLKDGQANHIAIFDTKVQGACAEFDLWRSRYTGVSLKAAIDRWCGGNSPNSYVSFLEKNSGIARTETVTVSLLAGERGLKLMKAQAHWEAGHTYPMSDTEWRQAQDMVFRGKTVPKVTPGKVAASGGVAAGTAVAVQQAAAAGYNYGAIIGIAVVGVVIAVVVWIIMKKSSDQPIPQPLPIPDPTPMAVQSRGPIKPEMGGAEA